MGKGSRSVSFVGRLSFSWRVLHRKFHVVHSEKDLLYEEGIELCVWGGVGLKLNS